METSDTDIQGVYNLIIQDIRNTLGEQLEYLRAFDTKFGVLFGFLGVMLSLIISFQNSSCLIQRISVILLSSGLLVTILGILPRKHQVGLSPEVLVESIQESKNEIQYKIILGLLESYQENGKVLRKKSVSFHWALLLSFMGVVLLASGRIL